MRASSRHWLCFGPPGVGKTLSAIRYSRNEIIGKIDPWTAEYSSSLYSTPFFTRLQSLTFPLGSVATLSHIRNVGQISGILCGDQAVAPGLSDKSPDS
jgi:hypothetical protein